jgi:cellobiose phosphorylase
LARNTWLSGTSSWTYVAATQHILGLRPEAGGLRIDPCLPTSWEGFTAVRKFRGAVFRIAVTKPLGLCRGVKSVTVDGRPLEGNVVPPLPPGDHRVEVVMG